MARQSVRWLSNHVASKVLRVFVVLCTAVLVVSSTSVHAKELRRVLRSNAETINQVTLTIHISLPSGVVGTSYSGSVYATGGTSPYRFTVFDGSLPNGLVLNSTTGAVTGTPTSATTSSFKLRAVDSNGIAARTRTQITISSSSGSTIGVTVSPTASTIQSAGTERLAALVSGTSNTSVSWSATTGSVSSEGWYTAPTVSTTTTATVKATSMADTTKSASATVSISPAVSSTPAVSVTINPSSATVQSGGTQQFAASVSNTTNTAVSWSSTSGSISTSGLFTSPSVTTATSVVVQATSAADNTKYARATIGVNPLSTPTSTPPPPTSTPPPPLPTPSGADNRYCGAGDQANFGANDGPAGLPQSCINTALASTPSQGNILTVAAGSNLQTALNNASCGDTLLLQAGATFTGVFTLPAKGCDSGHWITIRTSAPNSSLPPEGTRITPCYAGVSALPGRPSFNCASTANVMAKIMMGATSASGPLSLANGANYYRFIGLEITRPAGTGIVYNLVSLQNGGTADHIIFDRSWLHGVAQDETTRGIALGGSTYLGVVDSFFTDFHCTSVTGGCTDSQTIGGGLGSLPMGPYKIVNNFLEASGENILFGGGAATLTPADVEVRRNHFFKPLIWKQGQPGYVGGASGNAFSVKNHFELKNGRRVLFEGNILEYTWGGFSQAGYSVLLTPKNQSNVCPLCQVTDITIRYNTISHVGSVFQIANILSDSGGVMLDGERYSIHDVTADDINPTAYSGPGVFGLVMMAQGSPVLQHVTFNHITAFAPTTMFYIGNGSGGVQMADFNFTNSLVTTGIYPIWSTGGLTNCAFQDVPLPTLNACFSSYTFTANALIGSATSYPLSSWPTGNYFPSGVSAVQFTNYAANDYSLASTSPYATAGTDGKALGADTSALNTAIAGVY